MCRPCHNSADSRHRSPRGLLLGALLGLLLSACGSTPTGSGGVVERDSEQAGAVPAEPVLPAEAVQQFERAVSQMSSGDLAQAEQSFRSLAAAYPAYSGPLLNLGILHAKAGKLDEAEQAIRDAIARNGNNAAAFNQLGIVYRKLGRFKEADEAYTRAVQIDPNYALAYLNLGVLCDLYLLEPQRALEAYERYLSLAESPDAKVNGWVTELRKRIGAAPRSAQTNDAANRQANDQDAE
ncbi:MAG TPA: tetratricopeptide repeat protein [Steroidobacter sp.]|uniref:tetratricopeptide repeat protein n=1 Tax=Steroidobacter sp. TaxID=1978227 RepID=UPI002ED804EB